MSIEIRLAPDGIGIVATSAGVLSGQDLLKATERLRVEVERNPELRYALLDTTTLVEESVDTESLRVMAAAPLEPMPELIVVIVAPRDVLFGLSRMWEMLAERSGLVTQVVRTPAEAMAWLQDRLTQPVLPFQLTE